MIVVGSGGSFMGSLGPPGSGKSHLAVFLLLVKDAQQNDPQSFASLKFERTLLVVGMPANRHRRGIGLDMQRLEPWKTF